jgi:hypothetical protein
MFLTPEQVEKNINWLLDNASAPVRYLTHKYLLGTSAGTQLMQQLWLAVENSPEVQDIFSKQAEDGSWCAGGAWASNPSYTIKSGQDPVTPKYVTAVWLLPLLGEMGYTAGDGRIHKACNYVLSHGYFLNPVFTPAWASDLAQVAISPCRFAQYLIALAAVGLAEDAKVQQGYQVLLAMQRTDGGWALPVHFESRHWTRSCPFSSYHAVMALYYARSPAYRQALVRGLEFLTWHLSTRQDAELQHFFFHGHSTLRELAAFAELDVGWQAKPVQAILAWLMAMYDADQGCFRYAGKPLSQYSLRQDGMDARVARYRLHHLIEDDWLTYHLTRIAFIQDQKRD